MPEVGQAVATLRRWCRKPLADWLLAAALAVPFGAQAAMNAPGPLWRRGVTGLLGLGLLSLAARRRQPLFPIAVLCGLALVAPATGDNPRIGSDVGLLALFVAVYSVGAYGGRLELLCGLPLPLAALAVHNLLWPSGTPLTTTLPFIAAFVVGLPALAGGLVREHRAMVVRLEQQTSELMAERAARARHALSTERLRISRELHQVVAATVRRLLTLVADAETATADRGLQAVTEVEHVARQGLSQMRQQLGALSQPDTPTPAGPLGLDAALDQARMRGVVIHRSGLPGASLPATAELAASRTVELLVGDRRKSEIDVALQPDGLELTLNGHGRSDLEPSTLVALRERVRLAGGRLDERSPASSPRIKVWLPVRAGPPAPPATPAAPAPPATPAEPVAAPTGRRVGRLATLPWPAVLAAIFYAFIEIELQRRALPARDRLVDIVAGLAVSIPLAWCRSRPLIAAAASLLATLALSLRLAPVSSTTSATTIYIILPFCVAAFSGVRPALAGLAICLAALLADGWLSLASITSIADAATTVAPFVLGAWVAGRVLHARSRLALELHETNHRLAEERDATAREVVMEERQRLARDLHDVVGHSLTVIVLQAGAARRVWRTDRATALASLANAARVARGALTEHLQSLDALPTVAATASAGRGLGPDRLVEMARLAGVDLQVRVEGRKAALSPAADVALHRVVQEALTNALKHAPGREVTLVIRYSRHGMEVDISNQDLEPDGRLLSASAEGHGRGLPGMRERIESCGGSLQWERRAGRFRIQAQVPVLD